MKKCLHLRKTKPHWRRKQPKVLSRKERAEADRIERQRSILAGNLGAAMTMGIHVGLGAMAVLSALHARKGTLR